MVKQRSATLNQLRQKHPDAEDVSQDILLEGDLTEVHPMIFETTDGRRWMAQNSGIESLCSDLRKAFSEMVNKLYTDKEDHRNGCTSIEAFLGCRLIPLDKNPGLRPIGVGEELRRIVGRLQKSSWWFTTMRRP